MHKTGRLLLSTLLIILLVCSICGCSKDTQPTSKSSPPSVSAARQVVDMAGRTVTVPTNPKKVATMQGPTYELLFMLGTKDQIGLVRSDHQTAYPLALLTNPDLKNYPAIDGVGPQSPVNVEEFINNKVDLVVYWNIAKELEKFDNAGIPAAVIVATGSKPNNMEEALAGTKKQISFLAELLGGNAPQRYTEWEKYMNKTVDTIKSRTATISEDKRPIVYWGNTWNTNILSTYPLNPRLYETALCGGKLVSVEKGGQFPEITKEQLIAWNPEVIIVDNHGHSPEKIIEDLKTNADWATLRAVKDNRIYRIPAGVFFLDKGTSQPLYYYWLAKQLHPDLFKDIDLIKEMTYYYKTFYNYDLKTEEAEKVIAGWVEGI
ncbi:MAG: ABC transporter substrate-binding protein [Syntrophomonas sp.]|nr:ABC transporter substrate-binding protein [Syntrophomonas sp.]